MCGEIGISPAVFGGLYVCELALIVDGYRARQKREAEAARWGRAWLAQWVLIAGGAEPANVTPAKLLGIKTRSRRAREWQKTDTAADAARHL